MDRRLKPARAAAFAFTAVALALSGPWMGYGTLVALAVALISFALIERRLGRAAKPEWWIAAAWVVTQLAIASAVALTGGATSPGVSWLVIPAVSLPSRFGRRGLYAGIAFTALLIVAVTFGLDPQKVIDDPPLLLFPLALLGGVMAIVMALRSSELQHRSDAVLDQLTGMLNRKALTQRTGELEQQSKVTGQPIGLIICDIDHFKRVNDDHGHAVGDAVLRDVAYRIRKQLRAYDLAYRLGGEEFVVLLPGASRDGAVQIAQQLLEAVRAEPISGCEVTASFGVAVSGTDGLDFEALFAEADEALYRAKAGGRAKVCTADDAAFAVLRR